MYKRRTYKRPKRTTRRKYARRMKIPRSIVANNYMSCKRKVTLNSFGLSNLWNAAAYRFKLSDLPVYNEFKNLFQYYKINAVKLQFIPAYDTVSIDSFAASQAYWVQPRVYTLIDKNGIKSGELNVETKAQEYSNCRLVQNPLKGWSIYVSRPRLSELTEQDSLVTSARVSHRGWADTYYPDTWWDGCAVAGVIPITSADLTVQIQVVATYYMQFKNVN